MADGDVHATMTIPDVALPAGEHSERGDREGMTATATSGTAATAKTGEVSR